MHAAQFDYRRADSVSEAIQLLEDTDDGRLLAGGQALIPLLKKRKIDPGTLIDIGGIDDLGGIERTDSGIRIGALATHREITDSALVEDVVPVLPKAVAKITGGIQVHNVATVGGNLARAHPAYDYEAALLAANASVTIVGPDGEQRVPVAEFVRGACATCLDDAQLITGIEIPDWDGKRCGGYAKKKEPASGGAVVGVATDLLCASSDGDRVTSARIAVNGIQESAVRLTGAEDALDGSRLTPATVDRAVDAAGSSLEPADLLDNKKASAEYRHTLLGPYARRSIDKAVSE